MMRTPLLALCLVSCAKATGDAATSADAQPDDKHPAFARDDKAAVLAAYAAAGGADLGDDACVHWPSSFPRVVLVGGFADDRGCDTEGVFVDRTLHESGAEVAGLATAGFADATIERKEQLGRAWVDEVLHAFGGHFVHASEPAFEIEGSPKFTPVHARANKVGGVVVEGWIAHPSGMVRESSYSFVIYRFAKDGALEVERRSNFTVSGEQLDAHALRKAGG